jgi:hypothetical protein
VDRCEIGDITRLQPFILTFTETGYRKEKETPSAENFCNTIDMPVVSKLKADYDFYCFFILPSSNLPASVISQIPHGDVEESSPSLTNVFLHHFVVLRHRISCGGELSLW